ncbi:MAG: OmpA family protein [Pseudomonadota bacterium]
MLLAASALALAGCGKAALPGSSLGSTFTAERYLNADHGGSGFEGALAGEYTELGRRAAFKDARWRNSTAYMTKSMASEAGATPPPWSPDQLEIVDADLSSEYQSLVAIINDNKGVRPAECARAQAMWDQYLESVRGGAGACVSAEDALALYEDAKAACLGAAPVEAENNFIVYFGFNQSTLTERARETLNSVVSAVQSLGATALSIVGHADTVGSVDYNQALSERRARSVASSLVNSGVTEDSMTLAGRGERELARPTGDGVRERLNRRVEITLSN